MTIGQKIKTQREALNMTQEELGKLCGTTKQTIFKYETGVITNIPMDRLCVIAEKLRVSPCWILGWDETSAPEPQRLTSDEVSLLSDYRSMNDEGQRAASGAVHYFASQLEYKKAAGSDLPSSMAKDA